MRYFGIFIGAIVLVTGIYVAGAYLNLYGELEEPGASVDSELPRESVSYTHLTLPTKRIV